MLKNLHFLLTYACNYECDHCFLHCGPRAKGTFTLGQIREILGEAKTMGTIKGAIFEGGEPFLYYPLMLEATRVACEMGFTASTVTNGYWATSAEDAKLWLGPLREAGLSNVGVSDDALHGSTADDAPPKLAVAAAEALGIACSAMSVEAPTAAPAPDPDQEKGAIIVGGTTKFRGRAVDTLTADLPRRPWEELNECPYENLKDPARVHLDTFGHVHLCQGLSMGNLWQTPLSQLAPNYDVDTHPIAGPLHRGGPAELAREHNVDHDDTYIDECHFCYTLRLALLDKFPDTLAPRQVYGLS